jgi:hypothetical protein
MTTPPAPPAPWPSFTPFVEFTREARGGQFADELQGALVAARADGWRWQDALARSCRLICDPEATGRDLLHQVQRVSQYRPAAAPAASPAYTQFREQLDRRKDGAA